MKARKEYTCFWCGEKIRKGDSYERVKVQVWSESEDKLKLAEVHICENCYYDDGFWPDRLIDEKVNGDLIVDIVKAPFKP